MGSKLRCFIESRRNGQDSQVSGDNYRVLRYCGQFNGAREKLVLVLIVSVVVVVSLLSPLSSLRFQKHGNNTVAVAVPGVETN